MNGEDFWNRVKTLLKKKKITQETLAEFANLNFSNLKQQIFYKRFPDAYQAVAIAHALDTTVEYLVLGVTSEHPNKREIVRLLYEIESLV